MNVIDTLFAVADAPKVQDELAMLRSQVAMLQAENALLRAERDAMRASYEFYAALHADAVRQLHGAKAQLADAKVRAVPHD